MNIQAINTAIISGTWSNEDLNSMIDAVKFARSRLATQIKFSVRAGATVKFTNNKTGQTFTGTVQKMAQKYATIKTDQGLWRVPANMLTVV